MKATDSITFQKNGGVLIALSIITLWLVAMVLSLTSVQFSFSSPFTYLLIIINTHLYTGLFITAHDAMHGTVSPNKSLNSFIGKMCAILFAFNHYNKLRTAHYKHHTDVATEGDPDYYNGNFFVWYFHFLKNYISWWQILLMAITFNLLKLIFPANNVIFFWMLPSILSTFQLFYFGTYLPHRGEHKANNRHKSRSLKKNHLLAFLSCYFFGYHYEHHDSPATPWWLLYKKKEEYQNKGVSY